jgi:hypothetical protein
MAHGSDINERLKEWQKNLRMDRSFLFSTAEEFEEWCKETTSDQRQPIRRAAKFFHLDHKNPAHMALLLRILASVIFSYRKRGRPRRKKKWDDNRLCKLGAHRAALETPNDTQAAAEIKRLYPAEYGHDSAMTIRQRLPAARREYEKGVNRVRTEERKRLKAVKRTLAGPNPELARIIWRYGLSNKS